MFSQIKDVKHIEQDFCSVPRVMPQSWDLGRRVLVGAQGVTILFFKHSHVAYHIEGDDE